MAMPPQNFAYVKSLGVDALFDYRDAELHIADIREFTQGWLHFARDCVSSPPTASICASALSTSEKSNYSSLLPINSQDITPINSNLNVGSQWHRGA